MPSAVSPYGALREKNFQRYALGNLLFQIGKQMLVVAVGWEIYEKTHSAMALGYIGLAQVIPVMLLTLPAGHVADHYDRRWVVILSQLINALATLGILLLSFLHGPVMGMYLCLFLLGVGRAFNSPASAALLPQVVSQSNFTNAVTWSSINFQIASILGPALGGFLIAFAKGATVVYLLDCLCIIVFLGLLLTIQITPRKVVQKEMTFKTLMAGLVYVWRTPIILSAIALDLFAVLFGGAITLLPVYAKDILNTGPGGLGILQSAPALGAILMAICIARWGNFRQSGRILLATVTGFGIVMILFGLSQNFWLSCLMLFLSGMFDNVSVVIRQSLVQLRTPDEMRGRVSAINYVFIGASNELGGFESGLVAHFFSPVFSVVSGGVATLLVVLGTAFLSPSLRKLDRLQEET